MAEEVKPVTVSRGSENNSLSLQPVIAEEQDLFDVGMPRKRIIDAAQRILRACAVNYASWYSVVRECIKRAREQQQEYRIENNLPKTAKVEYKKQELTERELAIAECAENTIRALFGDTPAEYAKQKFNDALQSGDMRAFKIRLLIIKVRDTLKGSPLHRLFVEGIGGCIDEAERIAGCKPDPSPRRLSRAEQMKRKMREDRIARINDRQIELHFGHETGHSNGSKSADSPEKVNILISENQKTELSKKNDEFSDKTKDSDVISDNNCVTVHEKYAYKSVTCALQKRFEPVSGCNTVVRMTRSYDTVEQILDDIKAKRITRYETIDEICSDLKNGVITEVESLMFSAALDIYKPILESHSTDIDFSDLDDELGDMDEEGDIDDLEDEEGDDFNGEDRPYDERRDRGGRRSYNPYGLCGYGTGHYSGSGADWDPDDD